MLHLPAHVPSRVEPNATGTRLDDGWPSDRRLSAVFFRAASIASELPLRHGSPRPQHRQIPVAQYENSSSRGIGACCPVHLRLPGGERTRQLVRYLVQQLASLPFRDRPLVNGTPPTFNPANKTMRCAMGGT